MVKGFSRSPLSKKLLRDLRENAMQFIAMALLCFLALWVFSGLDGAWRLMDLTVESYYAECALADFWISASSLSRQELSRIEHLKDADDNSLHRLEEMDEVKEIKTIEHQFNDGMSLLDATNAAFSIFSGVALGLAFVICYNMGLMNFTERVRDYATLKVLGYHQKEIRALMLRESGLTALFGVLPGVALVHIILRICEFESMVFVGYVSVQSVVLASVITFVFTVFVEWLLTRKVKEIDMVEALKSVE